MKNRSETETGDVVEVRHMIKTETPPPGSNINVDFVWKPAAVVDAESYGVLVKYDDGKEEWLPRDASNSEWRLKQ